MSTGKKLIKGAFILTLAGIITRILGFIYRVYITNIVGSECIGLYQLIMPVYTLAWSISCAGFTTTISKLTAQEQARKEYGNTKKILKQCITISFLISLSLNIILYLFAKDIARIFFKDMRIILSLKILSFCFTFMAIGSCIRGYFFGLQKSTVPAISQVLEQCVHMLFIYYFIKNINRNDITNMCALTIGGIVIGEIISCLYVCFMYKIKKQKIIKKSSLNRLQIFNLIMAMAIPLTANRVTASFLATLENILIPKRLLLAGFSYENAISLYGKITGMAMPLIYFPSVFLVSLSVSLVPEVSQAYAIKNQNKISNAIAKIILFTSIIGIGAAFFFITFSNEIGLYIYHEDISHILKFFGCMCPFLYLQIILSGILNGMSQQMFVFKINLLSSCINLFFIYFLIPYKSSDAFIAGWFISLIISCLLSLNLITKNINIKLEFNKVILKPILAILLSCFIVKTISDKFIFVLYNNLFGLFISAILLAIIYFLIIISTGIVSLKELKISRA